MTLLFVVHSKNILSSWTIYRFGGWLPFFNKENCLVSLEFRPTHACPRVDRPAKSLVGHLFEGSQLHFEACARMRCRFLR